MLKTEEALLNQAVYVAQLTLDPAAWHGGRVRTAVDRLAPLAANYLRELGAATGKPVESGENAQA